VFFVLLRLKVAALKAENSLLKGLGHHRLRGMLHTDAISNSGSRSTIVSKQRLAGMLAMLLAILGFVAGCETPAPEFPVPTTAEGFATNHTETVILREGDVLQIRFPGAQNLNATPHIQRDGTITLSLVGAIKAAGKTLAELQDDLLKAYATQIDSKVIEVDLVTSQFPVFVTGAVLRPNKVMSDHPMTVLEAIMECGGFDYTKANLKGVKVLRHDGKHLKSFTLNLKRTMTGLPDQQFYVQAEDIIYVPEKFNWF
jgi:polysaccharide biosynthesis/export protein